jgi:hypothetical protein
MNQETITQEHPEYRAARPALEKYRDLYTGGEEFKRNAASYLLRRQKEPAEIYQERLDRTFYENYIGSIVDWYAATLFRREPRVALEGESAMGREFAARFDDDCDRRGTNVGEFFRDQVTQALVYGASYTLIDFPRVKAVARTRAEEDALGASRAYLKSYSPLDLINWRADETGAFEWAVLRQSRLTKRNESDPDWMAETTYTHYGRTDFQVWRRYGDQGAVGGAVELVDEGRHGLAKQNRVPLFELRLPDGLWLMRKAALLQLEHFNKSNALAWALTMGLFAMPVVYSDREFKQMIGESYYIQLGPEDKFGWTEPQGTVYQLAADNLNRLQREIYRICYLLSQAGGAISSGQSQSGLSKQRDFQITQEVLRAMGGRVKDTMQAVLSAVFASREDGLKANVSGLDEFDIGEFSGEVEDAERLLKLGISSETFRDEVHKKLALKYLSDASGEVKNRIANEIDGRAA